MTDRMSAGGGAIVLISAGEYAESDDCKAEKDRIRHKHRVAPPVSVNQPSVKCR